MKLEIEDRKLTRSHMNLLLSAAVFGQSWISKECLVFAKNLVKLGFLELIPKSRFDTPAYRRCKITEKGKKEIATHLKPGWRRLSDERPLLETSVPFWAWSNKKGVFWCYWNGCYMSDTVKHPDCMSFTHWHPCDLSKSKLDRYCGGQNRWGRKPSPPPQRLTKPA